MNERFCKADQLSLSRNHLLNFVLRNPYISVVVLELVVATLHTTNAVSFIPAHDHQYDNYFELDSINVKYLVLEESRSSNQAIHVLHSQHMLDLSFVFTLLGQHFFQVINAWQAYSLWGRTCFAMIGMRKVSIS